MIKGFKESRDVYIEGKWLDPEDSQLLSNHSPDGFNWGYGGSGPSQLALAILLHYLPGEEHVDKVMAGYQQFKADVIEHLPDGNFELEVDTVKKWIKNQLSIEL